MPSSKSTIRETPTTWAGAKPMLLYFLADWSRPCRQMAPLIDEVAQVYRDRVDVLTIDVDLNRPLAEEFGVVNIPACSLVKAGAPRTLTVGTMARWQIADLIETHG